VLWSQPSCGTDAASSPHGVDQACDRIYETTTDNEQDHPYQIIDLLLEFGESPRCLLRPPHKDGSQQENGRHGSRNDDDELVHRVCSPGMSREKLPSRRLTASFRQAPQAAWRWRLLNLAGRAWALGSRGRPAFCGLAMRRSALGAAADGRGGRVEAERIECGRAVPLPQACLIVIIAAAMPSTLLLRGGR
jgi:hypothetical protein